MFRILFMVVSTCMAAALPAYAGGIAITDAYARSATPSAPTAAAFLVLENHTTLDDRLVDVRSDAAQKVQLHTHIETADGVMQMRHVEDGLALPAHGTLTMQRGGDHVMFMGLTAPLEQGATVSVTLVFQNAGEIQVNIPVDHTRKADHAHGASHSHSHSTE